MGAYACHSPLRFHPSPRPLVGDAGEAIGEGVVLHGIGFNRLPSPYHVMRNANFGELASVTQDVSCYNAYCAINEVKYAQIKRIADVIHHG